MDAGVAMQVGQLIRIAEEMKAYASDADPTLPEPIERLIKQLDKTVDRLGEMVVEDNHDDRKNPGERRDPF